MKLSIINKLVQDGDLSLDAFQYLLNCKGECEWLDYKESLSLDDDKQLCDFTKDILAIKNIGGGYLLIGVKDKTWEPIGLNTPLPYDTKMVRDKIRKASGIDLDVDIVHHQTAIRATDKLFALIFVRSSKKKSKRKSPSVVAKDYRPTEKYGLRKGDIYFRKGDSSVKVQSNEELEDLLITLDEELDQDAISTETESSPFAISDGTYRLLERGYERFIGRDSLRNEVLDSVNMDPRIWIINVHGPGGVGKSALVNWVVNEFYQSRDFEAILQLTGKDTILTPTGIVKATRSLYSLENLLEQILNLFQEQYRSEINENKKIVVEYLDAWSTLLVLDNLETVTDGRILSFIQGLPPSTKAKVLITSREKTGSWELPISVNELTKEEVREFIQIKSHDLFVPFPLDDNTVSRVYNASGGLPLAIQWIIGSYSLTKNIDQVIDDVNRRDSPILEFSFGNIWRVLEPDAKAILAVMTIFDEPPTISQLAIATEFDIERIEKALTQLIDLTLVTKNTNQSDGRSHYITLPITLAFAKNKFGDMGDFETDCIRRYSKYSEQMKLQDSETHKFRNIFERYGLETDNEKRAAILCQRGESEMFFGNEENADMLFSQARDLAPQSSYVFAMSASFELAKHSISKAKEFAEESCRRVNSKTGALCNTIKARVLDAQHDHYGRVEALAKALKYQPEDLITKHQYGVALSRAGKPEEAINQFNEIISEEMKRVPPTPQLLIAMKTKMINLKRLSLFDELKNDLQTVDKLIADYPHLSQQYHYFNEFRE